MVQNIEVTKGTERMFFIDGNDVKLIIRTTVNVLSDGEVMATKEIENYVWYYIHSKDENLEDVVMDLEKNHVNEVEDYCTKLSRVIGYLVNKGYYLLSNKD